MAAPRSPQELGAAPVERGALRGSSPQRFTATAAPPRRIQGSGQGSRTTGPGAQPTGGFGVPPCRFGGVARDRTLLVVVKIAPMGGGVHPRCPTHGPLLGFIPRTAGLGGPLLRSASFLCC